MQPTTPTIVAPLYGYAKPTRGTKTSHPAPPQHLGAPSPDHTIRDRSAKQRALPMDKPARPFVSRCFEVKLPCVTKMVYIALAHRCKVWTEGSDGRTKQLGRNRIAADAGLTLTTLKAHLTILVSLGLIASQRTGRTNIYTVRIPSAALALANATPTETAPDREPWIAAGVSRRTWYRNSETGGEPTNTHGGARRQSSGTPWIAAGVSRSTWYRKTPRKDGEVGFSSGTDGQAHGPSDGQAHGPSIEGVSVGVRTKSTKRAVPTELSTGPTRNEERARCRKCEHTWPTKFGTACYNCGHDAGSTTDAQPTDDGDTPADGYRGSRIRNCPTCGACEREHEDRCQHCDWTREVWEARVIDGEA